MFKIYLYVYKKKDIYKYEFYLCNILEMDANCRSILFVAFFFPICLK